MTTSTQDTNLLNTFSTQMADAVERVGPALVQVNGRQRQSASGIIFAEELVLTADHVLEREDELTIQTDDGRTLPAQFVGRDSATDLAVLRVAGLNRSPAARSSAQARVGQIILAVGRPSGSPMASIGIVSAVGGPVRSRSGMMLERYIQTDATPYPGFSGGPLIDAQGAVVGMTTTGLASGVALGIPAEIAWRTAETLAQQGHVKRGFLGISSQPVPIPAAQRAGRQQERGLLVVMVEDNSPAQRGGLLIGDILVAFDNQTIADTDDLQALLVGERVGKSVAAQVIRGGALQTLQMTVGQRG